MQSTANVPAASLVVVSVILNTLGLPLESIGMLFAIDRFMDMGKTAVNVFGNTMVAVLVDKWGVNFHPRKGITSRS
ncbi:cation:dicarboxylate symporter family transporter [Caldanaerobacter subterraneus]|uniref:cation:dicarboxylate symporter family transporter n=1 Tax=Caldanaerobacter subterraneus TaxID=911092 RepID=UPI0009DB93E0|nr:cation:dicarboxylase symporter family transporter [Caldanaerobacter subterraneus]